MKKNKSRMRSILFAFLTITSILFASFFVSAGSVYAAGAYLTWNANTEENLAGYKVYYKLDTGGEPFNGTGANEGSSPVTVYLAQLDDPNSPSFSLTGLNQGQTYFFAVKAIGTAGEESDYSNPTSLTMSGPSNNMEPQANAGKDQTAPEMQIVTLDGSGSVDPDGELTGYKWIQLSGPTVSVANAASVQASFSTPRVTIEGATLAFMLTVSDGGGLTNSDICTVTVTYANKVPVASAGPDRTAIPDEIVTLDGTGSSDPDDGIATYSWTQTQGTSVTLLREKTSNPKFKIPKTAAVGSQFVFELTITDFHGMGSTDSCVVTVTNSYPVEQNPDTGGVPQGPVNNPDETPTDPVTPDDTSGETEPEASSPEETPPDTTPSGTTSSGETDTPPQDNTAGADNTFDGNHVPVYPIPVTSGNGSAAVMPVRLTLKNFYDPDRGDYHLKTQWRIFREDGNVCILSITSTEFLTVLTVPDIVFEEETAYYWKARFYDNNGAASGWSDTERIVIGMFGTDEDENGIPDEQEVEDSVDLNQDGLPDAEQAVVKSVKLPSGNKTVALSIENSDTVTSILSIEAVDPAAAGFSPEDEARAAQLPYGLINFKLSVESPGDAAGVTVHFDAPVPGDAGWMKFDPVRSAWYDYSDHARFSTDRMSAELEFVDGGFGDDDGVANGIIIDPSGPGLPFTESVKPSSSAPTQSINEAAGTNSTAPAETDGGSGGGGGCFITGAVGDGASIQSLGAPFFLLIGLGLLAILQRFKKR